jgi:hypothetical protein
MLNCGGNDPSEIFVCTNNNVNSFLDFSDFDIFGSRRTSEVK